MWFDDGIVMQNRDRLCRWTAEWDAKKKSTTEIFNDDYNNDIPINGKSQFSSHALWCFIFGLKDEIGVMAFDISRNHVYIQWL